MDCPIFSSLLPYNTFGIDVNCLSLVRATERQQLIDSCLQVVDSTAPLLVLGCGSNVVFTEDFVGHVVVIETKGIAISEDSHSYYLSVEAGENWHQLVSFCLDNNIAGLENLALIPGSVGAAPIQNIGAYGTDFSYFCDWVEYLDLLTGEIKRLDNQACDFGYRESIFKHQLKDKAIILAVGLTISKDWQPNIGYGPLQHFDSSVTPQEIFDRICETRMSKLPDPAMLGNVGSFFKNPLVSVQQFKQLKAQYGDIVGFPDGEGSVKLAAGWLIDNAGLKGYQVGGASVHMQQALVLVNIAGATGDDVCRLARYIVNIIKQRFSVALEVEPRIIGAKGQKDIADE
ncbi:UDP-N-acetylmuramate dehydrogenase [Shewanella sp. Isolate11]|uniref:UDP-N-acetylmuramate dehydrogenase n=1 Tax=Shewanella sp. Isolate11 TaxID=2908530 RepID=UPI001EFDA25F|nr:UDP-N-acetylmuramate dehydrogenase [Shewanella sp. Isolate11]MCG9698506.1 UDP-N-acetylmuramate dehydrogenase [Shewanella sp. Isolate11]